jgi:hypothetical protein
MERHEFSALIGRLERQADDNPQFYAVKVGALAARELEFWSRIACHVLFLFILRRRRIKSRSSDRDAMAVACLYP